MLFTNTPKDFHINQCKKRNSKTQESFYNSCEHIVLKMKRFITHKNFAILKESFLYIHINILGLKLWKNISL